SPDGTRIVSGSHDKTLRIWDATTGAQIGHHLEVHDNVVSSAAFSPDGTSIISDSEEKTLRIAQDSTILSNTLAHHHKFLQAHNDWSLSSDGWITFPNCPHGIIWIPPQFRNPLWRPRTTCIISRAGYTKLSFEGCVYGEEWFHCIED
ncbi:hypothetical protein BT96DRAFT_869311, partial [Gymnopus androsaceus JB14]